MSVPCFVRCGLEAEGVLGHGEQAENILCGGQARKEEKDE